MAIVNPVRVCVYAAFVYVMSVMCVCVCVWVCVRERVCA